MILPCKLLNFVAKNFICQFSSHQEAILNLFDFHLVFYCIYHVCDIYCDVWHQSARFFLAGIIYFSIQSGNIGSNSFIAFF